MLRKYEKSEKIINRVRTFVLFRNFVVSRGFTPLEIARPRGLSGAQARARFLTGFTIIEALVSMAVFAVAMTSIVGVYLSIQRLNHRSAAIQAITQNARFIHEDLTKLIANGSIDYTRYPVGTVPQPSATELLLIDKDGVQVRVYQTGTILNIEKGVPGSSSVSAYSGDDVQVLGFQVYITPSTNPFPIGAGTPREQPTVGIFLDLISNLGTRDQVRQSFQTSVATRQYPE